MSQAPIVPPNPNESSFVRTIAPAGMKSAICCDVVDRGKRMDPRYNKEKHEVSIHWMLEERIPEDVWVDPEGNEHPVHEKIAGRQFVVTEFYTFSLNEKANLRKMLDAWRGKAMTDEQAANFDLQKLVGVPCVLTISHNKGGNGKWYANVNAVAPLQLPFEPVSISPDYVRLADRPPRDATTGGGSAEPAGAAPPPPATPADDFEDELPF